MKELRQQVRAALTGPVCSIPTPFIECDDSIDKDAIAKMIDFQIENNFKMIFLTPGNSHYNAMSDADMREINEFCVKYTNKRALVCVTEVGHNTRRSLEMVMPPKSAPTSFCRSRSTGRGLLRLKPWWIFIKPALISCR